MKVIAALVVGFILLGTRSVARADDDHRQTTRRAPRPTVAVGINPLAMAIGRFGGEVLVFPVPSLALVASGHILRTVEAFEDTENIDYGTRLPAFKTYDRGFGGELGARIYFGGRSSSWEGFFVGAALVHGSYTFSYDGYSCGPNLTLSPGTHCATPYSTKGVAFDLGATWVAGPVYATLGVGFQVVANSPRVDLSGQRRGLDVSILDEMVPSLQTMFNGGGFRPRILLTLGFGG